jgi:hypothetical protein
MRDCARRAKIQKFPSLLDLQDEPEPIQENKEHISRLLQDHIDLPVLITGLKQKEELDIDVLVNSLIVLTLIFLHMIRKTRTASL